MIMTHIRWVRSDILQPSNVGGNRVLKQVQNWAVYGEEEMFFCIFLGRQGKVYVRFWKTLLKKIKNANRYIFKISDDTQVYRLKNQSFPVSQSYSAQVTTKNLNTCISFYTFLNIHWFVVLCYKAQHIFSKYICTYT